MATAQPGSRPTAVAWSSSASRRTPRSSNPIEGVWKKTKKRTTHNVFFHTTDERDAALTATFDTFRAQPSLIAAQVARCV